MNPAPSLSHMFLQILADLALHKKLKMFQKFDPMLRTNGGSRGDGDGDGGATTALSSSWGKCLARSRGPRQRPVAHRDAASGSQSYSRKPDPTPKQACITQSYRCDIRIGMPSVTRLRPPATDHIQPEPPTYTRALYFARGHVLQPY